MEKEDGAVILLLCWDDENMIVNICYCLEDWEVFQQLPIEKQGQDPQEFFNEAWAERPGNKQEDNPWLAESARS